MTDKNEITPLHEFKIPVIICPNCGEKEPANLKLFESEINIDNNLQEYWDGPHGPPRIYSTSQTKNARISGQCLTCGTSFEFSITATMPREKAITG